MIISNHLICHLLLLLYVSIRKKVVCHNCKLLRYFRNSTSVIYISKLLSVSSSVPCILLILTHLKEGVSKCTPSFFMHKAPTFTSWGFVIT